MIETAVSLRYRPEMVAAAALMALFLSHVALEVARCVRGSDRLGVLGWLLGGSLAIGTGVWAMHVLALLSVLPNGSVGHDAALSVTSWLVAVAAIFSALWTGRRLDGKRSSVIFGGLVCGAALCLMHVLGVIAVHLVPPVLGQPAVGAAAAALTMLTSTLVVYAFANGKACSRAYLRLVAAVVVSVALVGQVYFALSAGPLTMDARNVSANVFPADSLGLLAGLGAVVLLTMALLMSRLELRLHGSNERLAASLREANENLQKIAFHDPLTQLPNRLVFEERLTQAVAKADRDGRRLALIFIDLDGFKPINDSYGHSAGDEVLRAVGDRLRALARQGDTMARIGGDEFLMLLEGRPDEGSASIVARRVLKSLGKPYTLGDREVSMSCSIGIVFYPDSGAVGKLIAHADAAMYAAKRAGGSTYCFFEPRMDADAREQVELMRDLRVAVEQRQLELYYQPKIDAKSGQITAAEALLRWHHPVRGLMLPNVFIPVAERFGLIGAIGNWALDEVCRQAGEWRDKGFRMRVAVNLSAHQMRQDDLVDRIQGALRRHRIDPRLLTCEITESVAMEDTRATHVAFERLGRAGVHLSIDDFGTGYSSLSYLRQLPAEELKIDRSFVQDVGASADARAIVDAVVHVAHALGLKVVAEGVETQRQREILLQLGCDELQGYLFAKPMSPGALLRWAMDDKPQATDFRPSLFGDSQILLG